MTRPTQLVLVALVALASPASARQAPTTAPAPQPSFALGGQDWLDPTCKASLYQSPVGLPASEPAASPILLRRSPVPDERIRVDAPVVGSKTVELEWFGFVAKQVAAQVAAGAATKNVADGGDAPPVATPAPAVAPTGMSAWAAPPVAPATPARGPNEFELYFRDRFYTLDAVRPKMHAEHALGGARSALELQLVYRCTEATVARGNCDRAHRLAVGAQYEAVGFVPTAVAPTREAFEFEVGGSDGLRVLAAAAAAAAAAPALAMAQVPPEDETTMARFESAQGASFEAPADPDAVADSRSLASFGSQASQSSSSGASLPGGAIGALDMIRSHSHTGSAGQAPVAAAAADARVSFSARRLLTDLSTAHFYSYKGTDTQPPCSEDWEWLVTDRPTLTSSLQLSALYDRVRKQVGAAGAPRSVPAGASQGVMGFGDNWRNLQTLGARARPELLRLWAAGDVSGPLPVVIIPGVAPTPAPVAGDAGDAVAAAPVDPEAALTASPRFLAAGPSARNDGEYKAIRLARKARLTSDDAVRYEEDFARRLRAAADAHAEILAHAWDRKPASFLRPAETPQERANREAVQRIATHVANTR